MEHLKPMSQEDRDAIAIAREEKKKYAEENYINEFKDEAYWRELASSFGVRMPLRFAGPLEMKYLKRAAKATKTNIDDFVESTGFNTLKGFCAANPKWPAYALVGVFLEWAQENK